MANKKTYECTGGNDLTGLMSVYHEAMMKNELKEGKGAYKLSWAGGKSAPSFGGNQMDLAAKQEYRNIFLDIMESAEGLGGNKIISAENYQAISNVLGVEVKKVDEQITKNVDKNRNIQKELTGKQASDLFTTSQLEKIGLALDSQYGHQKINAAFQQHMAETANHIDNIPESGGAAKAFYSTDLGKALLVDYHNQLTLGADFNDPKDKLAYHIANFHGEGDYIIDDHNAFLRTLKYAETGKGAGDLIRRTGNVNSAYNEFFHNYQEELIKEKRFDDAAKAIKAQYTDMIKVLTEQHDNLLTTLWKSSSTCSKMMSDTSLKITINLAKKCLDLEIHSDWKVSCDREQEVGGLSIKTSNSAFTTTPFCIGQEDCGGHFANSAMMLLARQMTSILDKCDPTGMGLKITNQLNGQISHMNRDITGLSQQIDYKYGSNHQFNHEQYHEFHLDIKTTDVIKQIHMPTHSDNDPSA